jgi:hypothetical protein
MGDFSCFFPSGWKYMIFLLPNNFVAALGFRIINFIPLGYIIFTICIVVLFVVDNLVPGEKTVLTFTF